MYAFYKTRGTFVDPELELLNFDTHTPSTFHLSVAMARRGAEFVERDVRRFASLVLLAAKERKKQATRRKSNGDIGSPTIKSGYVPVQTLVYLHRRNQITLPRQ